MLLLPLCKEASYLQSFIINSWWNFALFSRQISLSLSGPMCVCCYSSVEVFAWHSRLYARLVKIIKLWTLVLYCSSLEGALLFRHTFFFLPYYIKKNSSNIHVPFGNVRMFHLMTVQTRTWHKPSCKRNSDVTLSRGKLRMRPRWQHLRVGPIA